eukprot:gene35631-58618_t
MLQAEGSPQAGQGFPDADQGADRDLKSAPIGGFGGASLGFLTPMDPERAQTYWEGVSKAVQAGDKALLVAEIEGAILGTVQVVLDMPQNQPHRGEVSKMIVHTKVRQLGLGMRLLVAAEERAHVAGKSLLVLDTQTGSAAEHLYQKA